MSKSQWTEVDQYLSDKLGLSDPALEAALQDTEAAKMPAISVSASQGKLLQILAMSVGAGSILEFGTLGGYSAICLARALPRDGKLITLEYEQKHAAVARANIDRAGLGKLVDIRVGPALETLPKLAAENAGPFDLVFLDADKVNTANYFQWSLNHTRKGGLIIVDNVVRNGAIIDSGARDASVLGIRRFLDALAAAKDRVNATAIQTVGSKGYDGLVIATVL